MANEARQTLLEALEKALGQAQLGLQKAETLEELCEGKPQPDSSAAKSRRKRVPANQPAPQPRYLLGPELRLRVAHHFDLEPAALVYDPDLGTLGVVEIFDPEETESDPRDPSADPASLALRKVKTIIDRAVYLRHLLWTEAERHNASVARDDLPGKGVVPLTVELVIACPAPEQGESESTALSDALGQVSRETAYLEAVGVNVLYHHGGRDFDPAQLRRAFPWLLKAAREWYANKSNKGPTAQAVESNGAGALESITLTNYRLQGTRKFVRSAKSRLHLVAGQSYGIDSIFVSPESLELGPGLHIPHFQRVVYVGWSRPLHPTPSACGPRNSRLHAARRG